MPVNERVITCVHVQWGSRVKSSAHCFNIFRQFKKLVIEIGHLIHVIWPCGNKDGCRSVNWDHSKELRTKLPSPFVIELWRALGWNVLARWPRNMQYFIFCKPAWWMKANERWSKFVWSIRCIGHANVVDMDVVAEVRRNGCGWRGCSKHTVPDGMCWDGPYWMIWHEGEPELGARNWSMLWGLVRMSCDNSSTVQKCFIQVWGEVCKFNDGVSGSCRLNLESVKQQQQFNNISSMGLIFRINGRSFQNTWNNRICSFMRAIFMRAIFVQAIFVRAIFVRAIFVRAIFVRAIFMRAIFLRAIFMRAIFVRAIFMRAIFMRAIFVRAIFVRAIFMRAIYVQAIFMPAIFMCLILVKLINVCHIFVSLIKMSEPHSCVT